MMNHFVAMHSDWDSFRARFLKAGNMGGISCWITEASGLGYRALSGVACEYGVADGVEGGVSVEL